MSDLWKLTDRRVLVCGASQGIGRAAAFALASLGADVTVLARDAQRLEALLPDLCDAGAPAARAVVADFDDRAGLAASIDDLLHEHGPIHVLVHNTGGPAGGPLLEATEQDLLGAFGRHVLTAQLLAQRLVPGMREAGYGRIVTVTSTSVREPIPNLGVSNLTRAAMASWVKTLSRELPPGVTINNVMPGYTDTQRLASLKVSVAGRLGATPEQVEQDWIGMVPEGRLGRPEELGAVIAFLCTPAASYVRGVSIPVDGGRLKGI